MSVLCVVINLLTFCSGNLVQPNNNQQQQQTSFSSSSSVTIPTGECPNIAALPPVESCSQKTSNCWSVGNTFFDVVRLPVWPDLAKIWWLCDVMVGCVLNLWFGIIFSLIFMSLGKFSVSYLHVQRLENYLSIWSHKRCLVNNFSSKNHITHDCAIIYGKFSQKMFNECTGLISF